MGASLTSFGSAVPLPANAWSPFSPLRVLLSALSAATAPLPCAWQSLKICETQNSSIVALRIIVYNYNMNEIQKKIEDFVKVNDFKGCVKFDEPMAPRTTFKIGGNAAVYAEPDELMDFIRLLQFLRSENIRFYLVGGASNIVFCDEEFMGVVISTLRLNKLSSADISENEVLVTCGTGTTMAQLVNFCVKNRLEGLQTFAGLPGTIGGALFMNARCFDVSICESFVSANYLELDDFTCYEIGYFPGEWDYKVSPFQNSSKLILDAKLRLKKSDKSEEQLLEECKKYIEERKSKGHFNYPSAGSVFRNNRNFGAPSGKLIDECGLKGKQIGNAQIAPFHGNFIINLGGATQKDVKKLVELTVKEIKEKKGFILEPEIIFVE